MVVYWALAVVAALGILGCLSAVATLAGRMRSAPPDDPAPPAEFGSLTVMVPLKGADDAATAAHLGALVASRLPGIAVEYLFAMETTDDAAYAVCERVRTAHPERAIRVVLSGPAKERMGKQHNLAAAEKEARGEVIASVDADVLVGPGTLAAGLAALAQPGTGAAYFLPCYRPPGPEGGALVALYSNYSFAPNFGALALVSRQPVVVGSLWIMRRAALERIGGLDQFTATVSDDAAIGRAVAGLGLRCVLVPFTVTIPFERLSLRGGLRHLAKWIAMLRAEGLAGYTLIVLTWHPQLWAALALLAGLVTGGAATLSLSLALLGAALIARVGGAALLNARVYRQPALPLPLLLVPYELLLVPLLFGAGLFRRTIEWRGRRYQIGRRGVIQGIAEASQ